MIILSKLADYGVIVATYLAQLAPAQATAAHIAADTRLPAATVAKVLKRLAKGGVVTALRGATGGYRLARPADEISVAEVVAAIDGAFAMTSAPAVRRLATGCISARPGRIGTESIRRSGRRSTASGSTRWCAAATLFGLRTPPLETHPS